MGRGLAAMRARVEDGAMTHAPRIAFATLAVIAGVNCLPPDQASPARDAPLIGRLQFQDRMLDLDVNAFANDPQAVPRGSYARVIADIDTQRRNPSDTGADDSQGSAADGGRRSRR
jgi:hypothetical protein